MSNALYAWLAYFVLPVVVLFGAAALALRFWSGASLVAFTILLVLLIRWIG